MKVQKALIHAPFEVKLANFWIIKSKFRLLGSCKVSGLELSSMTGRPIIKLDSKSEFVIGLLATNARMKFKVDMSRDKLDTLQGFYQISSRILISQTGKRKDKYNISQVVQINLNFGANICNLQSLKLFSFPLLFWNWCPQLSSLLAPNSRKYVYLYSIPNEWRMNVLNI